MNVESLRPPLTGVGRYTANLLAGLIEHPQIQHITSFAGPTFIEPAAALRAVRQGEAVQPPTHSERSRLARHAASLLRSRRLRAVLRRMPGAYQAREALANRALRKRARTLQDTVYHDPNFVLRDHDGPAVTTVHDLSVFHFPHFHPAERVSFMTKNVPRSLERADQIITPCEFVRQELATTFGIDLSRIHAVPLGVDAAFAPRSHAELEPVLGGFGLKPQRYVLSVATFEPRKNLERLVRAYLRLPLTMRHSHPLVLAGAPGWHSDAIEDLLRHAERDGSVRRIGYVDEARLPFLYAGATLFAFPSIYEGFGLPLLEAMACAAPVLASCTSSMPEVVGDTGLSVDPLDEQAIQEALARALDDARWREQAALRGRQRAQTFTWNRCVERTVEIYGLARKR